MRELSTAAGARRRTGPRGRHRISGRMPVRGIVLGAALLLAGRLWLVEPVLVASDSMEPALPQGSPMLLLKPDPHPGSVAAGDLVVFPHPDDGSTTVKRVVATGGQVVEIRDSLLFVDGDEVPEPFVDHTRIDGTWFGPADVPFGHVFVMGDNRGVSVDSRHFGTVPVEDLDATVLLPRP